MVASDDPVRNLVHDHAELNRQVLELSAILAEHHALPPMLPALKELREHMFLHFAREEEGLFPYLAEMAPDLELAVTELIAMHDEICGALARMVHVVGAEPRFDVMLPLFDRFESSYVRHAEAEHKLLETTAARLTGAQRGELAAMVAGN